ncbi:MAG: diacylglycerol kinase [Coriobacteriales bacterium]|nr:diacylglycerol kinase [Coriobacteriales bacterium]
MVRSKSLLWSFNYAVEGIVYALRTQRNMRLHVAVAALVLVGCAVLDVSRAGILAVVFAISLVFVAELVNTALEAAVDVATELYDPLAKIAKDVAAGAVLVAAMNALVVGWLVMFEPRRGVAENGLQWVRFAPVDLTVVALGLVLLAVLVVKALSMRREEGTFLHGGWPSGHAAVAFGIAVAMGFLTGNAGVLVLALVLAFLVAQSRVEGEIHSVPQVVVGALLGILLVTAVFQVFFRGLTP